MSNQVARRFRPLSPDTSQILWTIAVGAGLLLAVGIHLFASMNQADHGEITWIGNPTLNRFDVKIEAAPNREPANISSQAEKSL